MMRVSRSSKLADQHRVDLSGLAREEVWRELLGLMQGARGDRARVPSQKTVGRWLERWVEDGLMTKDHREGSYTGRPPCHLQNLACVVSKIVSFVRKYPRVLPGQGICFGHRERLSESLGGCGRYRGPGA